MSIPALPSLPSPTPSKFISSLIIVTCICTNAHKTYLVQLASMNKHMLIYMCPKVTSWDWTTYVEFTDCICFNFQTHSHFSYIFISVAHSGKKSCPCGIDAVTQGYLADMFSVFSIQPLEQTESLHRECFELTQLIMKNPLNFPFKLNSRFSFQTDSIKIHFNCRTLSS